MKNLGKSGMIGFIVGLTSTISFYGLWWMDWAIVLRFILFVSAIVTFLVGHRVPSTKEVYRLGGYATVTDEKDIPGDFSSICGLLMSPIWMGVCGYGVYLIIKSF